MIRVATVCAAALAAASFGATAASYPLAFKTVTAEQIDKLPGGYGSFGDLRSNKPAGIKKEPTPVSKHVLYGETRDDESPHYVFRLDESKGDGKGFDQLIVDINQNGDLTDDAVVLSKTPLAAKSSGTRLTRPAWFGPIPGPAGKEFAGGRPVFYAQVYVRPSIGLEEGSGNYSGYLRFRSGWYLEATAEVQGARHKIGIYDGNGNLRLGDAAEVQNYENSGEKNWYFRPADSFFVDSDGSGSFEVDRLNSESPPFAPILYLGGTPCKVSLEPNFTALRLEPWSEPLAEVALQPKGSQVRSVLLAWEHPAGQWQLFSPSVEQGHVKVPPGRYRLYYCAVMGQPAGADPVMVSGYQRVPKTPFKFEVGKENTLHCGAPLEVAATARKQTPQSYELPRDEKPDPAKDSAFVVRINANFRGADGEVFSTFATGPKLEKEPAKPVFRVTAADGKLLAKGNLEFG